MVRGVWNLAWSTGLGGLAVTLLRRQRERILFVLRWGRLPFEAGPTADDNLIVRSLKTEPAALTDQKAPTPARLGWTHRTDALFFPCSFLRVFFFRGTRVRKIDG
jgi:hypothetical protein